MSRTGQTWGRYSPAPRSSRNDTVRNYKSFNLLLRVVLSDKIWKAPLNGRTSLAAFTLRSVSVLPLKLLSAASLFLSSDCALLLALQK